MKSFAFFFLVGLLTFQVASQPRKGQADYLLIDHVDKLLIYNKYQQRITHGEEKAFIPFVPIRILSDQEKLNDNYTPCMKVEVQGNVYYLIKDDKFSLVGSSRLTYNRFYNKATLLLDTAQLVEKNGHIILSPTREKHFSVQPYQKFIRYFQVNDWTYVSSMENPPRFGWISFSAFKEKSANEIHATQVVTTSKLLVKAMQHVETKLNEVNSLYVTLFAQFNKLTNMKKTVPQWHSVRSETNMICILKPEMYARAFQESDQYLLRDFENIFMGTPYVVTYQPGKIVIRNK
jgi:hypothetical protein